MRFEWIALDRYGCFTGQKIAFGSAFAEGDFHIIYGPNEAGKSTLRDACIDFLYGFSIRSQYAFLHDYNALQISAGVSSKEGNFEGRRIKRQSNNFLGLDGTPSSHSALKAILGSVSRTGFEQMFSLNGEVLKEGGEEILRAQGDLGTLLFSAASGLSSLTTRLGHMQQQADAFYKKSARKDLRLNTLNEQLQEITNRIRQTRVGAGDYDTLQETEQTAKIRYNQMKCMMDADNLRIAELDALLDAIDPFREYQRAQEHLALLIDVPDAPAGWLEKAGELRVSQASAQEALTRAHSEVERIQKAYDTIHIDAVAISLASKIRRLRDGDLEARFKTASDIAGRERELQVHQENIDIVVAQLGKPAVDTVEQLLIPVANVAHLRELIAERGKLEVAMRSAYEEWQNATLQQKTAQEELDFIQEVPDLSLFAEQIGLLREKLATQELQKESKRHKDLQAALSASIVTLSPWRGSQQDLLKSAIRDDVHPLQHLKKTAQGLAARRATLETEQERLKDSLAGMKAQIRALKATTGVIDDADAKAIRDTRTNAWKHHKESLFSTASGMEALQASAGTFEEALQQDDMVSDMRFRSMNELADMRKAQQSYATDEALLERNNEKIRALQQQEAQHQEQIASFMAELALPPTMALDRMDSWLSLKEAAVTKAQELVELGQECETLRDQYATALKILDEETVAINLDTAGLDVQGKLKRCEETIHCWQEAVRQKIQQEKALRIAKNERAIRQQVHEKAEEAMAEWKTQWSDALKDTWINEATPSQMKEIIVTLETLSGLLEKVRQLCLRIDAMRQDQIDYRNEVKRLAAALEVTYNDDDPLRVADHMSTRIQNAEEAQRRQNEYETSLKDANDRLLQDQGRMDSITACIHDMCLIIPSHNVEALLAGIHRSEEKKTLQTSIVRLQQRLQKLSPTACDTLKELSDTPQALVGAQAEYQRLTSMQSPQAERVTNLHHEWRKAEDSLTALGSDAEVACLEEKRQILLLEIEDETHAFLRLSAGIMMVKKALDMYRKTHRSSMMKQASEAFNLMTRGAFRGLDTLPEKGHEVLVGLRSAGGSIQADAMSEGTRFQLYLALRIAGHTEFAGHRTPLPFFADDIMEPFDDNRSGETFKLLHDMSKRGQVVYLTHHKHLCEIATSMCGNGVKIHELPDRTLI